MQISLAASSSKPNGKKTTSYACFHQRVELTQYEDEEEGLLDPKYDEYAEEDIDICLV